MSDILYIVFIVFSIIRPTTSGWSHAKDLIDPQKAPVQGSRQPTGSPVAPMTIEDGQVASLGPHQRQRDQKGLILDGLDPSRGFWGVK